MVAVLRYTYRLRPGVTAERALLAEWDRCRWVWNRCVDTAMHGGRVSGKLLTGWRAEHEWLRAGSQDAQQTTVRRFLLNKRRKKFKSRKRARPTLEYAGLNYRLRNGRLILAKGIVLPVVWSRELPSPPTSVSVFRDPLGHWYASFVTRRETEPLPETDGRIGIDWGVREIATTTDPNYDLPHPQFGRHAAAELARAQRTMARRQPRPGQSASAGYRRAKHRAAAIHRKVARQRQATARRWARRVVADHQLIAVEDFRSKFLAKSRMARKAADGAIGTTKRVLIEYAQRAGREVVLVPPAYTTMTCSRCAARAKQRIDLAVRVFSCHACGHSENRDRNAARVILATAEFTRAGADAVRHASPSGDACGPSQESPAGRRGTNRPSAIR
jgi:putative transposase